MAGQNTDEILKGKLFGEVEPVGFAYVLNTRTSIASESKDDGSFELDAQPNDTLLFRCLGYRDTSFIVSNVEPKIFNVTSQTFALNEVKVTWFYSYAAFKRAFLNLKIDDSKNVKFNIHIDPREIAGLSRAASGNTGLAFSFGGGPTKSEKNYTSLLSEEKRYERLNSLTSYDNIRSFTGLKGPTLDSFIVYLRSKKQINPASSDYEILASVKMAYQDFLAMVTPSIDTLKIDQSH
jgi:hypothetical protein